jgi:hypothetical protein
MLLQIFLLAFIGCLEEFINLLYYSMCYNKFKYATGFFQMIRVFIWYYVLRTLVTHLDNLWIVFFYACGGYAGDILSLTVEPYLEKKIIWLHKLFKKKKGRKKKGWFSFQANKIKK